MTENLFVGFQLESGDEVEVPLFHSLISGQTQLSGKSTIEKTLAYLIAALGYKVLILDTKENLEDYADIGKEIPVCLRQSTDPLILLPVLESIFQRRLPTGYYSILSEITAGTTDYSQVISKAKEKEKSARSGWVQGACRTLYDLLGRLEQQLSKVETVASLQLPYEINRMVLNHFPPASQQLFIKNAFEDILRIHNKRTVAMLDEAYKFLPQFWGSACAKAIQDAITQTAGTESYIYIATQFLAPTNKAPLKACAVKFLGTQDHKTEAIHTLDMIPFKGIATTDDIMTLPLGQFYVTTKKWAKRTYFLPYGVPREVGRDVALGKKTSEYVKEHYLTKVTKGEDEEMISELQTKLEEETEKREKAEKRLETLQKDFSDMRTKIYNEVMNQVKKDLAENYVPKEQHTAKIKELNTDLEKTRKDLASSKKLSDVLGELIQIEVQKALPDALAKVAIATQPTAQIDPTSVAKIVDNRLDQRLVGETQIKIVHVDIDERIKELNQEEFLRPILDAVNSFTTPVKRALRYLYEKKEVTTGDLYYLIYQKRLGRPPGVLKMNIINPIEKALFAVVKGDKIKWALTETLREHIEDEAEIHKIEQYILSLLL